VRSDCAGKAACAGQPDDRLVALFWRLSDQSVRLGTISRSHREVRALSADESMSAGETGSASMTASELERQLVVFSLHGEHYGLPIATVREIIRYSAPTATAARSGLVQGIISWRGTVLPVVDLSIHLDRRLEIDSETRVLVVELSNGALGLIVDTVEGIMRVPAEQIEPLPAALSDNGVGHEVAAVGERLILLVDPERALGSALPSRPTRRRRTTG
jgi:purine-binding chemotaxis protein CheW